MILLQQPSEALVTSYLEFIDEMRQLGEKIWDVVPQDGESHRQFVERLLESENLSDGKIAESTYWACEGNRAVGRISLRHSLNQNLEEFGGHIGYDVRPSCRRRGVATEMLRRVLQTPKAKEIGKLLLTCAPDNIASNKTILENGGVLKKTAFVEKWQRHTNYYWIETK